MSSLPLELDFSTPLGRVATPERMNQAMKYLVARLKAVESLTPDVEAALATLNQLGLDRIAQVLTPIFDNATAINAVLQAIQDEWATSTLPEDVRDEAIAAVTAAFADYRNRYQGAATAPPTARPDGTAVQVGDSYFDTTLDAQRVLAAGGWKNAGSTVSSIFSPFEIVATAAQTVFPVPGGYDTGMIIVAKNGVLLKAAQFTAADGVNVTLTAGATAGDVISGYAFGAITTSSVYTKTASDARYRLIADSYTKTEVNGLLTAKADLTAVYTKAAADNAFLKMNDNLAALADKPAARGNLGLGTAATRADAYFAAAASVYDKTASDVRYSLKADTLDLTTGDARYPLKGDVYTKVESDGVYLSKAGNLAGLADLATARTNLGLGSAATLASSAFVKTSASTAGITLHTGTGAPASVLGADGDIYIG